MSLVYFIVIGLIAGWAAGLIMKGGDYGFFGDIIIGCIGACLGGFLFGMLGISTNGLIGEIVCAIVGAVVLIAILRFIKRKV